MQSLHQAAANGDIATVQRIMNIPNPPINQPDMNGFTPLHLSLIYKHEEIAEIILRHPLLDINMVDHNRNTALHHSIYNQQFNIAKKISLHPRSDINIQNINGETPLMISILGGNIQFIKDFSNNPKINPNFVSNESDTILHYAVRSGNIDVFNYIVQRYNPDKNAKNKNIFTPLNNAQMYGFENIINKFPSSMIQEKDVNGNTILHYAAMGGNLDYFKKVLQKYYSKFNDLNNNKENCFQVSIRFIQPQIAIYIMNSHTVNYNQQDNDGNNVVQKALISNNYEIFHCLINKCTFNDTKNKFGDDSLLVAVKSRCSKQIVQELMMHKTFNANVFDNDGNNAVMICCMNGDNNNTAHES
ncbi:hypothetical protein TVAG_052260 [Trichomonas vaginalis G3]|uniref:Uncharacterized protein n=1 Tax=Trichomonas vaginalis (strain ATCC PRA-98 / G3) TaxID=412133 RepID=A2G739_TRIV3|nr:protein ubiquitination [Trichomonas vaginalis G3]EAX87029.1 hypothetical protein TVAG_052260 [Trichomonas vaginalis G3]KAI5511889.1 protein ubiquitination [Trichomonas vaginalis G3]|eukprot:XP_001299959.1 hypothetical protein [Trichomonas vaginalis G3]